MLKRRCYTRSMGINSMSMKYQLKAVSVLWKVHAQTVLVSNSRKDAIARLPTRVWRINKIQSRAWSNCTCKRCIWRTEQSDWRSYTVVRLYTEFTKNDDQLTESVNNLPMMVWTGHTQTNSCSCGQDIHVQCTKSMFTMIRPKIKTVDCPNYNRTRSLLQENLITESMFTQST